MQPLPEKYETLICTLLFLMTRYSIEKDPNVCKAIVQHIDLLERHPNSIDPSILNTCKRLRNHWNGVSRYHTKAPNSRPISGLDTQIH